MARGEPGQGSRGCYEREGAFAFLVGSAMNVGVDGGRAGRAVVADGSVA